MSEINNDSTTSKLINLYVQLEIKKIIQNHSKFPTTFILPIQKLHFKGITYLKKAIKFEVLKDKIEETWKIKYENTDELIDSKKYNLCDVFLDLNDNINQN